jgi:hypothetical protein
MTKRKEYLIPDRGRDFSLFDSIQTSSEAKLVSYSMGTGGSFPRSKVSWVYN